LYSTPTRGKELIPGNKNKTIVEDVGGQYPPLPDELFFTEINCTDNWRFVFYGRL
jgi:hypothetical protein